MFRRPFAIFVLLGVILIGLHYEFYFLQPHYEGGDLAANALQIRDAKGLKELHGNYSRWGFNHPGPAFFYVYAAGEKLFFNRWEIAAAPHNAHAMAGALLQAFFFTWAIWIIGRRVNRVLTLPLLLLFAAVHFGTVNYYLNNSAFQSIWPPNVLLMPFLCFLVAGASVAAGEPRDLVPLVLAGCFLAHGHVAQPLFVLPLASLAHAAFWWNRRRSGVPLAQSIRAARVPHLIAAGTIALFLLPLLIDASRGEASNLRAIVSHFSSHSGDRKSLAQSALYFLTFLCHVAETEQFCDNLTATSLDFLRPRSHLLVQWLVIVAGATGLWVYGRKRGAIRDAPFITWLTVYFAGAVVLTLVWGVLQNGPMAAFNSFFNYAILFLPFVLLAILIASVPRAADARFAAGVALGMAIPLLAFASRNFTFGPDFPRRPPHTVGLHDRVREAAATDRQRPRTKLLLFRPEHWPEAARVALSLERLGYKARVATDWGFLFGHERAVDLVAALQTNRYAIWDVKSAGTGEGWLTNGPKQIAPDGSTILFSSPAVNATDFVIHGWDVSPGPFSWSIGKTAFIRFAAALTQTDVEIVVTAHPSSEVQRMSVAFNDTVTATFEVKGAGDFRFTVPAVQWNAKPVAKLSFEFPDALSPAARGISTDTRELGCAFVQIRFARAPQSIPDQPK